MDASNNDSSSDGSFSDFMSEVEGQVLELMRKTNKAPSDAYQGWAAFSSAINWKETWIISLLTFHVLLLLVIVFTRKRLGVQSCIFFLISILVRLAERINSYCAINWRRFASQDYFDKNGVFAGVLFSAPLLCMCLMMLVRYRTSDRGFAQLCGHVNSQVFYQFLQINFLVQASSALIIAKRLEIAHSRKKCK